MLYWDYIGVTLPDSLLSTSKMFNLSHKDGYNYNLALKPVPKGSETKLPKTTQTHDPADP